MNDNQQTQQIEIVELFDNDGKSMTFELLGTVEINNATYVLITSFDVDEATGKKPVVKGSPADVFVMKEVDTGNGKVLEPIDDARLMQLVFDVFKHTNSGKYTFQT